MEVYVDQSENFEWKWMVMFLRCLGAMVVAVAVNGCSSKVKFDVQDGSTPFRVTGGYAVNGRAEGDELLFSFKLPERDSWRYAASLKSHRRGYVHFYGRETNSDVFFQWFWISRTSSETERTIKENGIFLPWYSGQKGDGTRIPYTPTERQLKSGDWYSVGYPQKQFQQSMYMGVKNYYCVRSVFRRGGRTTWEQEQGAPQGAGYSVYTTCPFRTTDGRDAYFKVSSAFFVRAEDAAANPDIVEQKLAALDELLKPTWDSLEVMPTAYQFDAPALEVTSP